MIPPKDYGGMKVAPSRRCPCCDAFTVDGRYYCHCDTTTSCPDCHTCLLHLPELPGLTGSVDREWLLNYARENGDCATCMDKRIQVNERNWRERSRKREAEQQTAFREWENRVKEHFS